MGVTYKTLALHVCFRKNCNKIIIDIFRTVTYYKSSGLLSSEPVLLSSLTAFATLPCSFYPVCKDYTGSLLLMKEIQHFIWFAVLKLPGLKTEIFYCCGGDCKVARSDGRGDIKVEDSREAHQAIITRLGGDLRCERYRTWMLMHTGLSFSCSLKHKAQ